MYLMMPNPNYSPCHPSERLSKMPPYVFTYLDSLKEKARARGADLIDLGMGNPDMPTPQPIVDAIAEAVKKPNNHRYPPLDGKPEFREAAARWIHRRYGVELDPKNEVLPLLGSKEGLAHLSFAYTGPDSYSIVFSPYYPVHTRATWLAGGKVFHCNMTDDNNYMPSLKMIPEEVATKAKLMFINYPNNPTAAIATQEYLEELVAFCAHYKIVLVSDFAYSEVCFDGYRPPSVLSIPNAKSVAVEFHSFSKTFNMAGWRMGFACGNPGVVSALYNIKSNCDYGLAPAIQDGGIAALDNGEAYLQPIINTYQERRDYAVKRMRELGWKIDPPKATMYLWFDVPTAFKSTLDWCQYLIDTADIVITPGTAFGESGEGKFRLSLVSSIETLGKAFDRLEAKGIRYS